MTLKILALTLTLLSQAEAMSVRDPEDQRNTYFSFFGFDLRPSQFITSYNGKFFLMHGPQYNDKLSLYEITRNRLSCLKSQSSWLSQKTQKSPLFPNDGVRAFILRLALSQKPSSFPPSAPISDR